HQPLVVVGRVVGGAHHHAAHPLLQGDATDVVSEPYVGVLGPELGVAVVLPRGGVEVGRAHEAAVDDRVRAAEVLAVEVAIGTGEVAHDQPRHRLAGPGGGPHVDGHHVPPLGQLRVHPLGDVARRSGDHHASL